MDTMTRQERTELLMIDSTRYINLLSEADIDRLLANLAKRPILPDTYDHIIGTEEVRDAMTLLRSRYNQDGERRSEPDQYT